MSANELLQQVKELSPRERHKFVREILRLEEKKSVAQRSAPKHVKWPNVEKRARRIFGNRKIPNLVLLEREESAT